MYITHVQSNLHPDCDTSLMVQTPPSCRSTVTAMVYACSVQFSYKMVSYMRSGRKKKTMRSTQSSSVASKTARLTTVKVNTGTSSNCSGEHLHTCRTTVKVNTGTSNNSVVASARTRVQQVSNNNNRKHRYV